MDFINHVTLLAAGAVAISVQVLKLNLVPSTFANRHPVPTNLIVSLIATLIVAFATPFHPNSWTDWLGAFGTIAVVAAMVYNHLLGQWSALKAMESPVGQAQPVRKAVI